MILLPRLPARRPSLVQEPSIILFTSILDFSKRTHLTKIRSKIPFSSILFYIVPAYSNERMLFRSETSIRMGQSSETYFLSEALIHCSSRGRAIPAYKKVTTIN